MTVRSYSPAAVECVIALKIEANFADLLEVKEARNQRRWEEMRASEGD
nr:glycogen debranching N-terminal domain-containing protein [Arthrobacter crystallopoietes]